MESSSTTRRYGITLEMAQESLEEALEARKEILTSQRYKLGNRELERAKLEAVEKDIQYWQDWINKLTPHRRAWRGVLRDV